MKSLNLILDKTRKIKLYSQIYRQIAEKIENSEIPLEKKIPSVRALSKELNVGKNTVTKAYRELEKNGYIYSIEKSGFYAKLPANKNLTVPISKTASHSDFIDESVPTVDSLLKDKSYNSSKNFSLGTDFNSSIKSNIFDKNTESNTASNSNYQKEFSIDDFFSNSLIYNIKNSKSNCSGEENLIKKIVQIISKISGYSVNPSQIIISSCIEQILFNILHLPSIQKEKQKGRGLLKLAEESLVEKKQNFLILQNESEKIKKIFKYANFSQIELSKENSENLKNLTADIFYISETNLKENLKKDIFNWLNKNENRMLFEFNQPITQNTNLKSESYQEKILHFFSLENLIPQQLQMNAVFSILPMQLSNEYKNFYTDFSCSLSKIDQLAISNFLEKNYNTLQDN